ncbi:hypothetical protein L6164_013917 [Bauhinia variegata]|uniref:Uncharacterized protein n=1 Tax=Bauhinia variegata TaxID=167791 RepID=A0ACB9NGV6_BAUVA|nr:hypothetical protein L6164_013917 [Bauhinia variegata]
MFGKMIMMGMQLSWHLGRKRQKIGKTGYVVLSLELVVTIQKRTNYKDFVNKELILFSRADLQRSIPSMVDGLKPVSLPPLNNKKANNVEPEADIMANSSIDIEKVVEVAKPKGRGGSRKAPPKKDDDEVQSLQERLPVYNLGPFDDPSAGKFFIYSASVL